MALIETINTDTVEVMKKQDKFSLSVLRMLKSNLQLESINKKHDLTDEEVLAVIKKQVKVRKDSMEEYINYGKKDLADGLQKEIDILSKYLPEEMSLENINKELDIIFAELKPTSIKDMGLIIKTFGAKYSTQADMKIVSNIVRERLS